MKQDDDFEVLALKFSYWRKDLIYQKIPFESEKQSNRNKRIYIWSK